jgi:hypothetical protein
MSDLQILFLALALLYGWECACWLPRGSVAFLNCWGRWWRLKHPGTLLGNLRGGFIFLCPLPPLGTFLTAHQFPLSLSPDGVRAFVATSVNPGWRPPQTERFLRFDEIRTVEAKAKRVCLNGEVLLKVPSRGYAEELARRLGQLGRLPIEQRAAVSKEIHQASFDTNAIQQRWQNFQQKAGTVRWLANLLFAYLFGLAPVAIWYFGLKLCWPELLAGLLALTITTAVLFGRTHKALYPQADDERFTHFLTITLSPLAAIRACDLLSRPLLESFHPLVISHVFCSKEVFRDYARRVLLDIRHPCLPLCSAGETDPQSTELHGRAMLQLAVEGFLRQIGINPDQLTHPPKPTDEACKSYCPRCEAQFTTVAGSCPDCGGVTLVAWPK